MYDMVKKLLQSSFPTNLVAKLLEHHQVIKLAYATGDWEKCLVRGGKFAEATMKLVRFARNGSTAAAISVDDEIQKAQREGSLPAELRTLVPRHARVLYDHRNKRGGGHDSFEPNDMDSRLVVATADWTLGEFIRLYGGLRPAEAASLVHALISKRLPVIESIDGDLVPLMKKVSARAEIGVILYIRYPERTDRSDLVAWASHTAANVRVSLNNMKKDKEVHENSSGLVLTSPGVRAVENFIRLYLERAQQGS